MCILVVCEPNSTPTKTDLHNGACSNPHGYGFAIIADDKIISERSMSAKKSINRFLELRKQYPNGYAMWHARYATHGVKNEANCHPFQVGGSDLTYLAHNGILDVTIDKADKRSDTRVFAEDTLPLMGGVSVLDDDTVWTMVSKWASGSKIAIFTLDPNAADSVYIINESAGHWDDNGMWWSNSTYCDSKWSSYISSDRIEPVDSEDKWEEAECKICGSIPFEDANPYYCEMCLSCVDCYGVYGDSCMCWTPEHESKKMLSRLNQTRGWYDNDFGF